MKKRLFTSVLSVLLLIVLSVFGFAGCNLIEEKTISLNETAKELVVGESFTLTATTAPADAEVIWSTSDETIATVEDGTVTAISVGTAIVTAKNDYTVLRMTLYERNYRKSGSSCRNERIYRRI